MFTPYLMSLYLPYVIHSVTIALYCSWPLEVVFDHFYSPVSQIHAFPDSYYSVWEGMTIDRTYTHLCEYLCYYFFSFKSRTDSLNGSTKKWAIREPVCRSFLRDYNFHLRRFQQLKTRTGLVRDQNSNWSWVRANFVARWFWEHGRLAPNSTNVPSPGP